MSNSKFLENVPDDKVFWLCDGRILRNLHELADALENMSNDVFEHHVNKEKNDFSSWINDVIGDKKLANDLRKIKKINSTLKKIKSRISKIK